MNKKYLVLSLLFALAILLGSNVHAFQGSIPVPKNTKPDHALAKITMHRAVEIASMQTNGTPVEAELETEDGFLVYAVEVATNGEAVTEVIIDAGNGNILHKEREGDDKEHNDDNSKEHGEYDDDDDKEHGEHGDDDNPQHSQAQISLQDALKTALANTPGTAIEAELEKNGNQYEIEIIDTTGKTSEVKVNAMTGKVE